MKYLKVRWLHNIKEDPVIFYYELDNFDNEIKKIEIYVDGSVGYADDKFQLNGSIISECKISTFDEIAKQKEFIPENITKEEFYQIYQERVKGLLAD